MTITKVLLFGLALFVMLPSYQAYAGLSNSNAGTTVFNFLKIESAARPTAMGGAFTGLSNDPAALYYNPAGTAMLTGRQFIFSYNNSIVDIQSGFLGYIHPVGPNRKLLVYINYLNYGDFIRTNSNGDEEGTFSGSDILFGAGYAMKVKEDLQAGGVAKLIYEKIDSYSAVGIAVDLAVKWRLERSNADFGLMVQNLGLQAMAFVEGGDKESLPLTVRGGYSSRLRGLPLLVAADLVYPTDNDLYVALGAELLNLKPMYIRLGWTSLGSNYKTDSDKDDFAGFAAGFGFDYRRMQLSYTITPQAELGTSHRVTLTGAF